MLQNQGPHRCRPLLINSGNISEAPQRTPAATMLLGPIGHQINPAQTGNAGATAAIEQSDHQTLDKHLLVLERVSREILYPQPASTSQ